MELVYSENRERLRVGRAFGPGTGDPGPGRRHGLLSRRWWSERRRRSSPSPGASSATARTPGTSRRWCSCASGRSPPLRRELLLQHLALPDRDEPLDRLPAQRAKPRARARRDAAPGPRARGATAADATRTAEDGELARLFESVSGGSRRSRRRRSSCARWRTRDPRDRRRSWAAASRRCATTSSTPEGSCAARSARLYPEFVRGRSGAEHERDSVRSCARASTTTSPTRLPAPQRRILREHLAACDDCRRAALAKRRVASRSRGRFRPSPWRPPTRRASSLRSAPASR